MLNGPIMVELQLKTVWCRTCPAAGRSAVIVSSSASSVELPHPLISELKGTDEQTTSGEPEEPDQNILQPLDLLLRPLRLSWRIRSSTWIGAPAVPLPQNFTLLKV